MDNLSFKDYIDNYYKDAMHQRTKTLHNQDNDEYIWWDEILQVFVCVDSERIITIKEFMKTFNLKIS